MKTQHKKMIAPIVVSVFVVLYYIAYFFMVISLLDAYWKYVLGIVPAVLAIVMIAVCHQRIKEIRSGEEDDLGKY